MRSGVSVPHAGLASGSRARSRAITSAAKSWSNSLMNLPS